MRTYAIFANGYDFILCKKKDPEKKLSIFCAYGKTKIFISNVKYRRFVVAYFAVYKR